MRASETLSKGKVYKLQTAYADELVTLHKGTYGNGNLALYVNSYLDGSRILTITVNTDTSLALPADQFVCKNYSENKGVVEWLELEGIAKKTRDSIVLGYAVCPIMQLLLPLEDIRS